MPKFQQRSLELFLLAIIAIAILLRILYLGSREFWYDEVLSLLLSTGQKAAYQTPQATPVDLTDYAALLNLPAQNSIHDLFANLENLLKGLVAEPHPPLFFLSQHLWLHLFGNSEAAVRSLGALLSIGAIACAYGLGRCLLGHRGGLLLAALLGINPYYLFHSLNVRMYGPLVLWTILSAWSLLELIDINRSTVKRSSKLLWSLILIGSVTAGLMTFYYFAIEVVALAAVVLLLDRQRWWQYALYLATGTLITIPWVWWGTRQQLRNADLERFAASTSWIETVSRHINGVLQTLGIQLLIGDWVSSVPPLTVTLAGIGVVCALLVCSVSLWRHQRRTLGVALLLGIFPLLLMLAVDIVSGNFTVGFGWGRSVIFILPGCLLLLAAWIESLGQNKTDTPPRRVERVRQWRQSVAMIVLLLYLGISIADWSGRSRWMFHKLADIIDQEPTTPTLIAMNSQAWGHVLRLAYYLPPEAPVALLAQKTVNLAPTLEETITEPTNPYYRLIWLDSARPVWSAPTEAQKLRYQQETQKVLDSRYQLEKIQPLVGTMELDKFTAYIYKRSASP